MKKRGWKDENKKMRVKKLFWIFVGDYKISKIVKKEEKRIIRVISKIKFLKIKNRKSS